MNRKKFIEILNNSTNNRKRQYIVKQYDDSDVYWYFNIIGVDQLCPDIEVHEDNVSITYYQLIGDDSEVEYYSFEEFLQEYRDDI